MITSGESGRLSHPFIPVFSFFLGDEGHGHFVLLQRLHWPMVRNAVRHTLGAPSTPSLPEKVSRYSSNVSSVIHSCCDSRSLIDQPRKLRTFPRLRFPGPGRKRQISPSHTSLTIASGV